MSSHAELPIVGVSGVRGVGKTTALRELSSRLTALGVEHRVIHPLDLTPRRGDATFRDQLAGQSPLAVLYGNMDAIYERQNVIDRAHARAIAHACEVAKGGTLVLIDRTAACSFAYASPHLKQGAEMLPRLYELLPPLSVHLRPQAHTLDNRPRRARAAWDDDSLYPTPDVAETRYGYVAAHVRAVARPDTEWHTHFVAPLDTPADVASTLWNIIRKRFPRGAERRPRAVKPLESGNFPLSSTPKPLLDE
jgi:thymidylate kinase